MYVFKAASLTKPASWANQEPSVKIGMITMKVYLWLAPSSLSNTRP